MQAFSDADAGAFLTIFGGGDAAVASGLLQHTALPQGGVDASGNSVDGTFELTEDPWPARFQAAALSTNSQKVQVKMALTALQNSLAAIPAYTPEFITERAIAFMLDVANQFGDAGAKSLFVATKEDNQSLADHLSAIADAS